MSARSPQADGLALRLPYQARWCAEEASLAVIEKSRRIGISWADASERVLHAASGRGNVTYMSYSREMTRTYIDDCVGWAGRFAQAIDEVVEEPTDFDPEQARFRLHFPGSGKSITALSSSPRGLRSRGKPGDVAVIDEAAFCDDLDELIKAGMAITMWGGKVRFISTHNGAGSPFARLVEQLRDGKRAGALHTVTLDDAIREGLVRRIFSVGGQTWTPAAEANWREQVVGSYPDPDDAHEELFCKPRTGGGTWLSWLDIRAAEHEQAGQPALAGKGSFYIGIDVARRKHLWIAIVLEVVGDVVWAREIRAERDIPFSRQYQIVDELVARYNPIRVVIDQGGMGEAVVEEVQRRHGAHRVEGVLLTAPRRLDVATALKECLQDRRLRLPADEALRADLHSIKSTAGPTGQPRLVADSSDTDGHADRFWSLAMGVAAARQPHVAYRYESVGPAPRRRDFFDRDADLDEGPERAGPGFGGLESHTSSRGFRHAA